ncbi:MAG: exodeoxyribonuclease VII large subunit [Anaerolineae bacterium]|nr:exodeoxyribonuclease VII large subunit [Anaerolineae bacterium]
MVQMTLFARPFTVSELTLHIKGLFDEDETLADVWVEGEVSNLSRPSSGHIYFSLTDAGARLGCVLWRSAAARIRTLPQNGDRVLAHGRVSVYEAQGTYQLYVDEIQPAGLGEYYIQLERLKQRLRDEGLFAEERKRPLPDFPRHIGIVTSPDGAALRDILHVLRRRFPCVAATLAPTQVQGADAPAQIVAALEALNRHTDCDVLIVARGGGSIEELAAFNDEQVARAIARSRIPVVTGIGHETDFTIADFVADRRAPTPTAAAEFVTPDRAELLAALEDMTERLSRTASRRVQDMAANLAYVHKALRRASPEAQIRSHRQRVDELTHRMTLAARQTLSHSKGALKAAADRLHSASPQATLARGYAIVSLRPSGRLVTSTRHVRPGDAIRVQVSDGAFHGRVAEDREDEESKPS